LAGIWEFGETGKAEFGDQMLEVRHWRLKVEGGTELRVQGSGVEAGLTADRRQWRGRKREIEKGETGNTKFEARYSEKTAGTKKGAPPFQKTKPKGRATPEKRKVKIASACYDWPALHELRGCHPPERTSTCGGLTGRPLWLAYESCWSPE
jgi:hypothetical protein